MKFALLLHEAAITQALDMTIRILFAPHEFVDMEDAEIVIADRIEDLATPLEEGKYAIHYCRGASCGEPQDHPTVMRDHPKFRLVLHQDEANAIVLVDCLRAIGVESGRMQMIEVVE